MAVITIPRTLREKLGDDGSDSLVELLNTFQKGIQEDVIQFVLEKFERLLVEETGKIRVELAETKAEIIKWMFIFWVGQLAALLGILFVFFRK